MLAHQLTTQLSFSQLFDALPDAVLFFRAVRDGTDQQLVDFVIDYINPAAYTHGQGQYQLTTGMSVLHNDPNQRTQAESVFGQLKAIVETGQPAEYEYYNETLNEWLSVSRSQAGDGVLSIIRIITTSKQAALTTERQKTLLTGILNTSLNVTFVYEAIRSATGQVDDFRVLLVNERGRSDVLTRRGVDPVGNTLLGINPNSRQSGQFNLFCQIIESGEPVQTEQFYPDAQQVWYSTAITKLNDGVVVTGIDITAQKQTALEIERQSKESQRQASFLNNILDATSNGIVAERAIRNEAGTIVDFLVTSANQKAAEIVQLTIEELVGKRDLELHPELRSTGLFDAYVRTVETGEPQLVETHYNDGRLDHWVTINTRQISQEELVITFSNVSDVKRTQQALEQARAELQAVIDSSQTGIFVFSPVLDQTGQLIDFRFKTINRMVAALVGQTPDVVQGKVASDWFTSYRETGLFDHYKYTFETGEDQRFDSHYNVDGFDVWFDVQSIKFGDDVLVTFTNYTDLKQAQLAGERQTDLLRSVLDSSNSGIIAFESIRDERGKIVDFSFTTVNQACERLLGIPLETMRGNKLLTLFPGNVDTGLFALYVNTAETGEPSRTEVYYNLDGLDFWLDISAQKLGDGFVVTFTDVSVQKRAAQLVEQSAAELQTVIDTSQTGIFLFSPVYDRSDGPEPGEVVDFRFRVANRQLASYVGQEPGAVIGGLGSEWFPAYKTNGLFEAYRKTYLTGEPQRFDIHYDGNGIDVWLDIMATKMGNEVLVTFGDYTPLKKLQQELETSVIDLQRSNANLEQFAYVASHDLQEPLRKIQAFGDILETKYGPLLGEHGSDMIHRMQSAAARMQILIKDVLAYSRIATRRDAITLVDLGDIVTHVVEDLETTITDHKATVTVDALPTIVGDAGQLRQLFQNLLSNSLKFMKPQSSTDDGVARKPDQSGAFISITAQPIRGRDAGMTILPSDADRSFHLIEIADNGIGFDPHHADRIFQVFQRLHNRTVYQGTGIGLAIVKKVVENHNGYVQAVGRPGKGATFRIMLPA